MTDATVASARVSSGAVALDQALDGGFVPGTAVLMQGARFSGAQLLARQVVEAAIAAGAKCLYIVTDASASDTIERFAGDGAELRRASGRGTLAFLDASGQSREPDGFNGQVVDGPTDLARLGRAAALGLQALGSSSSTPIVVVDSLSTLMILNGARETYGFVHGLLAQVRGVRGVLVMVVDDTMHAPRELATLVHLTDLVLAFTQDQERERLLVRGAGSARRSFDCLTDGARVVFSSGSAGGRIR